MPESNTPTPTLVPSDLVGQADGGRTIHRRLSKISRASLCTTGPDWLVPWDGFSQKPCKKCFGPELSDEGTIEFVDREAIS